MAAERLQGEALYNNNEVESHLALQLIERTVRLALANQRPGAASRLRAERRASPKEATSAGGAPTGEGVLPRADSRSSADFLRRSQAARCCGRGYTLHPPPPPCRAAL